MTERDDTATPPTPTAPSAAIWVAFAFVVALGLGLVFGLPFLLDGDDDLSRLRAAATGELAAMEVFDTPRDMPNHPLLREGGKAVQSGEFGGKLYLINFWATWCAPCRDEMPSLSALQGRFNPSDFEIVLVSLDIGGFDVANPFLREVGVDHLQSLLDRTNRMTLELGGSGLPITILVDAKGRWVARMDGPAEWDGPDGVRFIQTALEVLPK